MGKPKLFSDVEIRDFRKAIDALRSPDAYAPGRWSVAHLNRRTEITGKFPERVTLRDISLRTMEQLPGVLRTEEERHEFLRDLVRAGVPEVNTSGFLRRRTLDQMKAEVAAAKEISENCRLVYLGPMTEADFDLVGEAGYDSVQLLIAYLAGAMPVVSGPTYHRLWHDRDWKTLNFPRTPRDQIERALRLTRMGVDRGIHVSAAMNMVAYASETYIQDYCGAVADAGADEVNLIDSSASLGPEAYAHIVRLGVKAVGDKCRIGVHAHDMFGLAVASTIEAAKAGATVLEVAVNGYVIGPQQADLAATAVALEALYGVKTGIDLGKLTSLSRSGERLTGIEMTPSYPITGRELFALGEPDQYVEEVDIDPLLHKPITPELVGADRPLHVTSTMGPFGMWRKLDQLGIDVEKREVMPILKACWAFIETTKRSITDTEVAAVARSVLAARSGE